MTIEVKCIESALCTAIGGHDLLPGPGFDRGGPSAVAERLYAEIRNLGYELMARDDGK
jgi:hypothetical protein